MKILLVEDHAAVAQASMRILERQLGYETQVAASGKEALNFAQSMLPDVIVADINLPDMSGYEVAARLREKEAFQDTTLIALSAHDESQYREQALNAGFDAYYRKPMDLSQLAEIHKRRRDKIEVS